MTRTISISLLLAGSLICTVVSAASMNGKLPMNPNGHKMNSDMPASGIAMGVPKVLESAHWVERVDRWYAVNTKACARISASASVKYACASGSIMIYPHKGKTHIAFVPAMVSMFGAQ